MTSPSKIRLILAAAMLSVPLDNSYGKFRLPKAKVHLPTPRLPSVPTPHISISAPSIKLPKPSDVTKSVTNTFSGGIQQVSQQLKNGTKIITETIPKVGKRTYEIIDANQFKVVEQIGHIERSVERAADGTVHYIRKVGNEIEHDVTTAVDGTTTVLLKDGSKVVMGVTEDGRRLVSEAWTDGTRRATSILKDSSTVVRDSIEKGGKEITRTTAYLSETAKNIKRESEAAIEKAEKATVKAAADCVDVGKTVVRFQERQAKGYFDTLSNAEKRIHDGKLADAAWGMAVEPLRNTSHNAAKATQENKYVAIAGAVAASTYGGPAGAAAYASWSTYEATGNPGLAMKAGLIAGVSASVTAQISSMPAVTKVDIALKATAVAAQKGVEIRLSGGSPADIERGMLQSMLASAATATSSNIEALKASDEVTQRAFATAANAATTAIVNGQKADQAIKEALLGAMAESICKDINAARGNIDDRLTNINQAILTGTVKGLGTAMLGGDVDQALRSVVNDAGKVIVQDTLALAKTKAGEQVADYKKMFEHNEDVRAIQAYKDQSTVWINENKAAAEAQFNKLQNLDVAKTLGVKQLTADARKTVSEASLNVGALIVSAKTSATGFLQKATTEVVLTSTAPLSRYGESAAALQKEIEGHTEKIASVTGTIKGEIYEIKSLQELPEIKGVKLARELAEIKIPAPSGANVDFDPLAAAGSGVDKIANPELNLKITTGTEVEDLGNIKRETLADVLTPFALP